MLEIRQLKYEDLNEMEKFIIKNKVGTSAEYTIKILKCFFIPYKIFSSFPRIFPKLQHIFVCKSNKKIIGLLMATNLDLSKKIWYVFNVVTDKNYRGKGIATRLINYSFNYLKDNFNVKKIILDVEKSNKIAIKLYRKFGFKKQTASYRMILKY